MPRIAYSTPTVALVREITDRRGGAVTPLDLLLTHNADLARG